MITLYTKPECQQCEATQRALVKLGHVAGRTFEVVDVTVDAAARDRVMALGYSSAPVVVSGDTHFSGFRPDRLKTLPGPADEKSAAVRSERMERDRAVAAAWQVITGESVVDDDAYRERAAEARSAVAAVRGTSFRATGELPQPIAGPRHDYADFDANERVAEAWSVITGQPLSELAAEIDDTADFAGTAALAFGASRAVVRDERKAAAASPGLRHVSGMEIPEYIHPDVTAVVKWATPYLRSATARGAIPALGSDEWVSLPSSDPRKTGAVVEAALHHVRGIAGIPDQIRRELAAELTPEKQASLAVLEAMKEQGSLKPRPTFEELQRIRWGEHADEMIPIERRNRSADGPLRAPNGREPAAPIFLGGPSGATGDRRYRLPAASHDSAQPGYPRARGH